MGILTIRIDDELENDLDQLSKVHHRTKWSGQRLARWPHVDFVRNALELNFSPTSCSHQVPSCVSLKVYSPENPAYRKRSLKDY